MRVPSLRFGIFHHALPSKYSQESAGLAATAPPVNSECCERRFFEQGKGRGSAHAAGGKRSGRPGLFEYVGRGNCSWIGEQKRIGSRLCAVKVCAGRFYRAVKVRSQVL